MRSFDFNNFISYLNKKKGIAKDDREIFELCFYGLLHTLDRENEVYILKMEKLFYKRKNIFSNGVKTSFYFLLNLAYGERNEHKKLYLLYSRFRREKMFGPGKGKEISFMLYREMLTNFLNLNKITEAEKFTLEYSNYLNTDKKESFYNYSFARIEFARKNFEKALDYISKVDMIFFHFKYDLKNLYLRIYYELKYYDEAYALLDSYSHFLKNHKNVSEIEKTNNKSFTDHYKKLLNITISGDKLELRSLKNIVIQEEKLFYKAWFLEKLESLR